MATTDSLRKLFRYHLHADRPVNRGGCGHIWRATDLLFDRPVAIKTITEALRWAYPEKAVRGFRKEAIAAARLGEISPYIVRVFDIGLIEDVFYYVMDWIDPEPGFTLIDLSERVGRMTLAHAKGSCITFVRRSTLHMHTE